MCDLRKIFCRYIKGVLPHVVFLDSRLKKVGFTSEKEWMVTPNHLSFHDFSRGFIMFLYVFHPFSWLFECKTGFFFVNALACVPPSWLGHLDNFAFVNQSRNQSQVWFPLRELRRGRIQFEQRPGLPENDAFGHVFELFSMF